MKLNPKPKCIIICVVVFFIQTVSFSQNLKKSFFNVGGPMFGISSGFTFNFAGVKPARQIIITVVNDVGEFKLFYGVEAVFVLPTKVQFSGETKLICTLNTMVNNTVKGDIKGSFSTVYYLGYYLSKKPITKKKLVSFAKTSAGTTFAKDGRIKNEVYEIPGTTSFNFQRRSVV